MMGRVPSLSASGRLSEPFRITTRVDFEADGKQFGSLDVPHSSNESAWGALRVPIVVSQRGRGPTILFTGGNHGDEYEGPIALMKLARSLPPEALQGRLILLPALNLPAVLAGTRVSPIDQVNMNRAFPGDPRGTPTLMIADYLRRRILPMCDAVIDLHSGGKTLNFVPFCGMHLLADPEHMAATQAALLAFGAPLSLVIREFDVVGMLDTAVEELGKPFLFTELGGGGTASAATVAVAERGIQNLVRHFGLIEGAAAPAPTRLMHSPDPSWFVIADDRGIFEILVDLGGEVAAGQPVGQIHDVERVREAPAVCHAAQAGVLIGRHAPGLIKPGDCLAVLATDYAPGE
jgi:N2-acetyl-L-2,4-diaminobutanoate deacetylase